MNLDIVGRAAWAILPATLGRQAYTQSRDPNAAGARTACWRRIVASHGFFAYSALLGTACSSSPAA